MSKVNELRQKFASTGGTPAAPPPAGSGAAAVVPPPLPAARDSRKVLTPVSSSSGGTRPPLPAIPSQIASSRGSSSVMRRISTSLDNGSFLHNNKNNDEDATNDADNEDLYLTPDEELKAAVSQQAPSPCSPSAISSSKPLPSPKVPPPRKPLSFNNQSRPQSHSVSEVKVNGGGSSGDGTFFRSTSSSSLPIHSPSPKMPKESSNNSSLFVFQYYAEEDLVSPLFWDGSSQARGASRMGFGTDMQDKTAHDAILKLNDQEFRLMEALKRVVQHKIKADKEYATSLGVIGTLANRFEEDAQINHKGNVVKAWSTVIKETETVSKLIRQHADEMSTAVVDRLGMMIKDKIELKKQYIQERTKIDTDYMKVKGEVKESFARYQKAGRETKDLRLKYDEALYKGKSKDLEKAKDKYKKAVLKLHKTHNEYVLSLKAATLHQEHYRTSILPRLLECLQQSQESQIAQIKQTMTDLANLSSTCMGDFVTSQNAIMRGVADVRPDVEYSNFVDNHKVDPPAREYFEFDKTILEEFSDGMEENAIVLDNLTLESVQHTHTSLGESLTEVRDSLTSKKLELQTLDEEIRGIQPSPTDERVLLDLLSKQKAYRDVSREIQDLKCQEAKLNAQYTMLDQKLSSMGDEDNLPPGLELPEAPTNSMTLPTPEKKKLHLGSGVTRMFGKRGPDTGEQQKQSSDIPIEEEEWYHGALPRLETEELLVNDGDFLVREKSDASGQYVLSAKTNSRIRHFPIQLNEDNMYRLEGTAFPSVGHLVRYQLSSAVPVTKASQACLIHPVVKVRDEHDLRHEEIELGDKLGAGHFGDVFRGKLIKNGTPVAVKTCKETVDAATRRKFLMEANILKQYNHPNIVKLIGVCTDKHPIYIVMELVPGGDLLSFLRNDENDISTRQMVKMAEETGAGMSFLESKNCIHRDLAARNCLVGLKNTIKISDFGMSREDDVYTIKGGAMRQIPIKWTAPEAMNYGKYTTMSDVWSFGILLWEIFSHGSTPYPGMNNTEAREKVEQGYRMPPAHGTPDEMYSLMTRCWEYGDEHRPRFKEIHAILKRLTKTVK